MYAAKGSIMLSYTVEPLLMDTPYKGHNIEKPPYKKDRIVGNTFRSKRDRGQHFNYKVQNSPI